MRSWLTHHSTWQYVFWTDADNLALFQYHYPQNAYIARAVSKIALADMARYALLHLVGGLYVDADFECLRPFDELHRNHSVILSHEPLAHTVLLEKSTSAAVCNAIMVSAPGHPMWMRALEAIKFKFDKARWRLDAVSLTGLRLLKETFEAHFVGDSCVTVLASEFFYPEVAYWNIGAMRQACASHSDTAARGACAWLEKHPHGHSTNNTHATHHW